MKTWEGENPLPFLSNTNVLSNRYLSLSAFCVWMETCKNFVVWCWRFNLVDGFGYFKKMLCMFVKLSNNKLLEYGKHRETKRIRGSSLSVHELTSTRVISGSPPSLCRRSSWISRQPSNLQRVVWRRVTPLVYLCSCARHNINMFASTSIMGEGVINHWLWLVKVPRKINPLNCVRCI